MIQEELIKMSIKGKIKATNNKTKKNKAQYNLDRQTVKISALLSGNVSKYEFLTSKDVLLEKDLLEKAATIKRFEYSFLDKNLKAKTSAAEKQYQVLNKIFKADEKEELVTIKKEKLEITNKSNLMYNSKYSLSEYRNVRKYYDLSLKLKYKLLSFFDWLNEFRNFMPQTKNTKFTKKNVFNNVAKLCNTLLPIYFKEYNNTINGQKKKWMKNMILVIHFLTLTSLDFFALNDLVGGGGVKGPPP